MRLVLSVTISLLLSLSTASNSFAFAFPLQNSIDVGAIDIMQEKQATDIWHIFGQSCGETNIQITNAKGIAMNNHHSNTGDIDWSFSTANWPAGDYTVVVDADDPACARVINFKIGK